MTAAGTASNIKPGEIVPWGSLERSAFEGFPDVVDQLRDAAIGGRAPRNFLFLIPLGVLVVVIYAAPIWGLVVGLVLRERRRSSNVPALTATASDLRKSPQYIEAVRACVERVGDED